MIYLKNNTETQAIYIPRQTVLGSDYIATTEKYEKGYNDGFKDGKEQQKEKLSSLHVAENGQYEREDGWNVVTVDVPDLNGSYDEGYKQGHTEGYNEGYTEGEGVGYNQGKTDGINEQKGKLSQITISENGTYAKEDGYSEVVVEVPDLNGSYDEGYEQGQADIAAKARVLNVTKNGTYLSKFSESIIPTTVTGVYADGTKFYNYAQLGNKVYNTNITVTQDSVVELWYKGDNAKTDDGWGTIFGCTKRGDEDFWMGYFSSSDATLNACLGQKRLQFSWDENIWHHIIMKNDGLWIDDALIGSFNTTKTFAYKLGLNSDGGSSIRHANGCYGMIKIDSTIIIPTADGFLNTNTGELLEVVKDGGYTFTENLPIYGEGELYKTINVNIDVDSYYNNGYNQGKTDGVNEQKGKLESINITENGRYTKEDGYNEVVVNVPDLNGDYNEGYNQGKADVVANASDIEVTKNGQYGDGETLYKNINVNVVPKVNVEKAGLRFGKSAFTEVPEWADFNGITDMSYMFYYCIYLKKIPLIDTSNATDMSYMFCECRSLQTIPILDTSNVKNMEYMFGYCNFQTIPLINTSKVTNMQNMFFNCEKLQTIPQIDTSNVTRMDSMFSSCTSLVSIPALNAQSLSLGEYSGVFGYVSLPKLTDFGGFLNLKCSLANNYSFKSLPNLTYESCINVLNGLYDFTGNGETPNSNQGKLKVHQNFLDKVGDEISIGTNKGWTITA